MDRKQFTVTAGQRGHEIVQTVELDSVFVDEALTPKLAARVARVAVGHRHGVTVSDGQRAYRLYAKSHRKLEINNA